MGLFQVIQDEYGMVNCINTKRVLNWACWCTHGRSIRGHDSQCWTRVFSTRKCTFVWYITKWFEEVLFPECTNFTRLSVVLDLVHLKARYGWSNKNFIELLDMLKKMLPNQNTFPKNHWGEKDIMFFGYGVPKNTCMH